MKDDEKQLLQALLEHHQWEPYSRARSEFADAIAQRRGIHDKRSYCLLSKWTDKKWWEYGVSARSGWFTPEGIAELKKLFPTPTQETPTTPQ
jgi:hypothetical protein